MSSLTSSIEWVESELLANALAVSSWLNFHSGNPDDIMYVRG
jgi:hypothetical protein